MLLEYHYDIERDASKVHYVIDLIQCSIVYVQYDDVLNPYWIIQSLHHLNALQFLLRLEYKVDRDYHRVIVSIAVL